MSFAQWTAALLPEVQRLKAEPLAVLFDQDAEREAHCTLSAAGLSLCYGRQWVDDQLLSTLDAFLENHGFRAKMNALFAGKKINSTENRAVLHPALRDPHPMAVIAKEQAKLFQLTEDFYKGAIKGATGQRITDVVNLGIGGSDLGPRMVVRALKPFHQHEVKIHFVANVDGADLYNTLETLRPETTLFIVASKSFTTQETLLNANTARTWLAEIIPEQHLSSHFVGITSADEKAIAWGILPNRLFAMWDFIGGRYSLWSAIGLPICLAIGIHHFKALLQGAHLMDQHFKTAPFKQNMPVLMAAIAIFNQNFGGAQSHAVIPYDQSLELFPAYLQQLDMESNGKRVDLQGKSIDYQTGVALWGAVGTNGQHAFHQLFHQGTLSIPIDFILPLHAHHPYLNHHTTLMANCYGQMEALLRGETTKDLPAYKVIPGSKPCHLITMEKLNPETLGALIALYEHKIFFQSLIWNINAFDQWGVELGKALAEQFNMKSRALV